MKTWNHQILVSRSVALPATGAECWSRPCACAWSGWAGNEQVKGFLFFDSMPVTSLEREVYHAAQPIAT